MTLDWEAGRLRLAGELDRSRAERVTDAFAAMTLTGRRTLTVDVAGLTFCDLEGVRALARARELAISRGRRMHLVEAAPLLVRLMRLAGIEDVLVPGPADPPDGRSSVLRLPVGRRRGPDATARAHGGPAHGEEWTVDTDEPPAWVELPVGTSSCYYRLRRQRRSGRPARDDTGSLCYVPMTRGPEEMSDGAAGCRILPFARPRTAAGGDARARPGLTCGGEESG